MQNTSKYSDYPCLTPRHQISESIGNSADVSSTKCIYWVDSGKKKSWTPEEDAYLIRLINRYGAQKWSIISENMPGRIIFIQAASANSAENDGTTTCVPR